MNDGRRKRKPGFMVYFDKIEPVIAVLSDSDLGRLFAAMIEYSKNGTPPAFEGILAEIWTFISHSLDNDSEMYEEKCLRGAWMANCRELKKMGIEPLSFDAWREKTNNGMIQFPDAGDQETSQDIARCPVMSGDVTMHPAHPTTTATATATTTATATANNIISSTGGGELGGIRGEEPAKEFSTAAVEDNGRFKMPRDSPKRPGDFPGVNRARAGDDIFAFDGGDPEVDLEGLRQQQITLLRQSMNGGTDIGNQNNFNQTGD